MRLSLELLQKENIVKLAPMECFTSCLMTYIKMSGEDPSVMLLDYWNLHYKFKTLISSKDARQLKVGRFFDIDMTLVRGNKETLEVELAKGNSVIFLCKASQLSYFPSSMLGLEDSGFQHSILICGREQGETEGDKVVDPMLDYIGSVSMQDLVSAGSRGNGTELLYFKLTKLAQAFQRSTINEIVSNCAERNLKYYEQTINAKPGLSETNQASAASKEAEWMEWFSNRQGGAEALVRFAEDARQSLSWTSKSRKGWIDRNLLTITAIIQIRQQVWKQFCQSQILSEEVVRSGEASMDQIVKGWKSLHFKLIKYKTITDGFPGQIDAITQTADHIRNEELQILRRMAAIGESLKESAE
ncbi:hypothetical protein [Paenibacillus sp. LPE1-1-1.1]|uniref:hypothetical protein n=1 Tax=Paenibacillus sp. LPE1-1-1.1 TaxID=3135230 RepID=UPI0034450651